MGSGHRLNHLKTILILSIINADLQKIHFIFVFYSTIRKVIYANCGKSRRILNCDRPFRSCCFFLPKIGISGYCYVGSMEPTLKTGGIVFTDTKRTRPSVGDIVTFPEMRREEVSPLVVAKQSRLHNKGDANNMEMYHCWNRNRL